jgi:hypothetical protein
VEHAWRYIDAYDASLRADAESYGDCGERGPDPRIQNAITWPDGGMRNLTFRVRPVPLILRIAS